jgi:hypothetical protein
VLGTLVVARGLGALVLVVVVRAVLGAAAAYGLESPTVGAVLASVASVDSAGITVSALSSPPERPLATNHAPPASATTAKTPTTIRRVDRCPRSSSRSYSYTLTAFRARSMGAGYTRAATLEP